jgi:hypothetical protein
MSLLLGGGVKSVAGRKSKALPPGNRTFSGGGSSPASSQREMSANERRPSGV